MPSLFYNLLKSEEDLIVLIKGLGLWKGPEFMIDKNYHMGCIAATKLFLHIPSRTISSIGFLKDYIIL
ncbi:hypothetical protein Cycma_3024 [Cyclobacterium marinum DSM 745]|uniref:Uncharacterized protein n=1 Tax=Cyclobacterium marinum (strain ATCC 25205 / DSM 745 / LMG 13164 / NCIMB 1802) TaxID=880070 RepID=G0J568_CYCMS|nr:hypothetical protein Cycma_3024 [Cyclobacterium marinum DSM 745]